MTHSVNAAEGGFGAGATGELLHAGSHKGLGNPHIPAGRWVAFDGAAAPVADKDDILALVAHEFRGPLSAISNALEMIDRSIGTQCARERAVVRRQVKTLVRLVEDVLDARRMVRDGVSLCCDHVSLREVIANALETTAPLLRTLHHRLRVRLPDDAVVVYADRTRLAQVFGNLLSNAAHYTPTGGCIEIGVEVEDGGCCVRIRDDGRGIEPDVLQHVFEPYFQGTGNAHANPGGLGLGLALAKAITERHGGTLAVRSDGQGLGSEFSVRLPLPMNGAGFDACR